MLRLMSKADNRDAYSDEETIARREALLRLMLSTPPRHKTAKVQKANQPKKRGRPSKKPGET